MVNKITMTQFQQEQDDLMADFDAPIGEKETREFTTREDLFDKKLLAAFDNRSSTCNPKLFKRSKILNSNKTKTSRDVRIEDNAKASEAAKNVIFEDNDIGLFDETPTLPILEWIDTILVSFWERWIIMKEGLIKVSEFDVELKCLTSVFLICYGGSWTSVAGVIAAVETFGTREVTIMAYSVGTRFLTESEEVVEPKELTGSLKTLGLHAAVLTAVLRSSWWSEICLTTALALKLTNVVPMKDILSLSFSTPVIPSAQLDDYFSLVDNSWFDLLAIIVCNIVLLFVTCFSPRLTTAMYMCYFGVSSLAECAISRRANFYTGERWIENLKMFWIKKTTQYWVWGFVVVMGLWQAAYDYSGVFLSLSWLMFLHPVVSVFKVLAAENNCEE